MMPKLISRVKTGSIKNVYAFTMEPEVPVAPYVILKFEKHPVGILIRVIVHYPKGNAVAQDLYVRNELSGLLDNYKAADSYGNIFRVKAEDEWVGLTAQNEDNTISMERSFYVPSRLH